MAADGLGEDYDSTSANRIESKNGNGLRWRVLARGVACDVLIYNVLGVKCDERDRTAQGVVKELLEDGIASLNEVGTGCKLTLA